MSSGTQLSGGHDVYEIGLSTAWRPKQAARSAALAAPEGCVTTFSSVYF